MTSFYGISEHEYEHIKIETMTHTIAQLYVDAYTDRVLKRRAFDADEALEPNEPLSAIEVYHIRQAAMDEFNAWMQAIKEQT